MGRPPLSRITGAPLNSSPNLDGAGPLTIRADHKCSAPERRDVVRMSDEDAADYGRGFAGMLGIHGSSQSIDLVPLCNGVPIAKQQESLAGFANQLGTPGNVVTDLLDRELFFDGHGGNDLAARF